tara:strand:+ start:4649 stop:4846 length:198 start_codon:yes stop_codon:yes gene_type:complete
LLFSQVSNLGASCSKKPALDIPHERKPRRFASVFINWVYLVLELIIYLIYDVLALMGVASFTCFL